jgi:hypothetical protein
VLDGDLDRAEALAVEAQHVGARAHRPEAGFVGATQLASIRWAQGRVGEVADMLSGLVAAVPHFGALRALEAVAIHASGDESRAHRLLAAARTDGSITELDHNQAYLAALINWAELTCALDDVDAASDIAACLAPYPDQFAFTGGTVYGPVAHALGLLAFTLGDTDAAARHFGHAIAMTTDMPSPFFTARAQAAASRLGIPIQM